MLSHDVYFTLKNQSPYAQQQLLLACHKYLSGHPGVVFYAAGTLNQQLRREVNDFDFDVSLQVVFAENKPNWAKVRVFDADVESAL